MPPTPTTTLELWELDADAGATKLGTYGNLPAGSSTEQGHPQPTLTADDALIDVVLVTGSPIKAHALVRRRTNGTTETIYSEDDDPSVLVDHSRIFTGP